MKPLPDQVWIDQRTDETWFDRDAALLNFAAEDDLVEYVRADKIGPLIDALYVPCDDAAIARAASAIEAEGICNSQALEMAKIALRAAGETSADV